MAVWGYVRVSSKDQNEDRQIQEIMPLVTTESHLLVEKQSGKDFNRPIYNSLKNIMREDDVLVIKSLDSLIESVLIYVIKPTVSSSSSIPSYNF